MSAATNSSDTISDLKNKRWNKLIVAGCIVIVAWYLHRFVVNKGNYSDPVVQIKNGWIRGRVGISRGGKPFYEFLGIPFAQPPVGPLRFQSPKPIDDWKGVLSTRRFRPKLKWGRSGESDSGAVIAFIHGGYYVSGHTSLYGPKYLLDEDIVLVTISYRLGALGFLNLGIKDARGPRLKDQRFYLALKWIQDTSCPLWRCKFGNDHGAKCWCVLDSGSSVHFHMLAKASKGLFHKAISNSGTIQSPWAWLGKKSGIEQALRLSKQLDCPVNNSSAALDCLLKKDVNKIVEVHSESLNFLHDPLSVFKPTVEEIDDDDAFLTQDPFELMKSGNIVFRVVPVALVSTLRRFGCTPSVLVRDNSMLQSFLADWREIFATLLLYCQPMTKRCQEKFARYYFGQPMANFLQHNRMLANFLPTMFCRTRVFLITKAAYTNHSVEKSSPVYLFYYAQPIPLSFGDVLWAQYGILPAFVEIGIYLGYAWPEYDADDGWNKLSKEMVKSWVEFAKTGEPAQIFGAKWNHAFSKETQKHSMPSPERKGIPVPQYLR
ncbi:Esterase FE4 [Orchesella cincta]|uniref:Esterase FE4 n=1 Tax=Orchesella cincta TaxID=48709 RepID=A0A1D2N9N0_ORCCI|nr:Esterase FE4 [Orchesella cincta]